MQAIELLTGTYASIERRGTMASRSEVRRWCKQGWVLFNAEPVSFDEEIDFPIISVVIHSNQHRITLW